MLRFLNTATQFLKVGKKVVAYAQAVSTLLSKVLQPFEDFMDDIRELEASGERGGNDGL